MLNLRDENFSPTWHLENVRETAKQYPYTFYVPSEELLDVLKVGDCVRLLFVNDIKKDINRLRAERMWVTIIQKNDDKFVGKLDNKPFEMKQLKLGDIIHFSKYHIMSVDGKIDPIESIAEAYLDRCWTTKAIIDGEAPIGFICRTEPMEKREKGEYHDTGWQILSGDESDEYMDDSDTIQYIALGSVLNLDDSFIHLLDSPVGSAFYKDDNGKWVVDEYEMDE